MNVPVSETLRRVDYFFPLKRKQRIKIMSDTEESPTPAKVARLSSSITEISSDPEPGSVDAETQKALEDIDCCQSDIDALNEKASEEILQVEMKYNKLRRPHFEKRNNLIKHIPNFWVTSFLNHPRMANIVEEEEEECLHYLKQVDVEEFEDIKSGFSIQFQFASNPYFTDEVLTKEFHLAATDGKPPCRSTQIHWKPNMDLTRNTQAKHVRRQRGEGRSFFSWLTDTVDPARDRIAEMIKDDLWPNPLQYYLASDIEVEENGVDSDGDDDNDDQIMEDDSVVIVGDDDDDDDEVESDDDVYEVKDDDDDDDYSGEELEETVESIEVEDDDDDDDDDAIEVLGSDSEAELLQETSEISQDGDTSVSQTNNADGKGDNKTGNGPDTSQTSEVDSVDKSQNDNNTGDSDALLNGHKNTTDGDDSVLDSDNLVSQNDDSVLLDNDGNDSDLLKEDDDDDVEDGDDANKKIKDSSETVKAKTSVVDGEEKAEDGVD
ncbi:protein SET-like isoform X2 [Ruditapes philippinarum]|uniref:protein SET-like isoform X2 n=1 Tax=Ruditapes philippinarum TaxID=129788 RepID=UPI00295A99C3|nr:protein SET-like isoform X2 [Ruditapes philippinarum]